MRIAYLSTFYPFRGGIAQFNASLFREFEKRHEVAAFTFTRQYPDLLFPGATQYVTPSDRVDAIPAAQVLDTINPLSYFKAARALEAFKPDLLVMKFWMPFFAPSLGTVAGRLRKRGTRVVAILDNLIPHERRPGDLALIRYFLRRNDGFVAMSETVERDLKQFLPEAQYVLKPHPIYDHFGSAISSAEARAKLGLPRDKRIVLFFGFIRDYKGLDTLIRAAAHLSEEYCVVIAGEMYGDFAKYEALLDEANVRSRCKLFIRYIDDAEVPAFFSAAEVCVLPYKSATQSGIVQIAFNFDLPVIATDVGGLAEMVEDNLTGLILRTHEPQALARLIRKYFAENLREPFSRNLAQRRHSFSWAGFAEAILSLHESIVRR
ncbi:glycosyltransferase [candidate division KSB1 bacterium]|nr:glycosyltransferase [candidate division KSB1 bacterium]